MGGETCSNRDSRAAGSALPTSGHRLQQQQSQKPASSEADGSVPQQEQRQSPICSAAGGSGTQRQCEDLYLSTTQGNAGEGVSLRPIRKKKKRTRREGLPLKYRTCSGLD
jgi:hypothetical protein